jgi:hypothetical protein
MFGNTSTIAGPNGTTFSSPLSPALVGGPNGYTVFFVDGATSSPTKGMLVYSTLYNAAQTWTAPTLPGQGVAATEGIAATMAADGSVILMVPVGGSLYCIVGQSGTTQDWTWSAPTQMTKLTVPITGSPTFGWASDNTLLCLYCGTNGTFRVFDTINPTDPTRWSLDGILNGLPATLGATTANWSGPGAVDRFLCIYRGGDKSLQYAGYDLNGPAGGWSLPFRESDSASDTAPAATWTGDMVVETHVWGGYVYYATAAPPS